MPNKVSKKRNEKDKKILYIVSLFLEKGCRISDEELGKLSGIPSSTVGRYLTSNRTRELIGIDNYAFIKKERNINKLLGRKKGGSKKHG